MDKKLEALKKIPQFSENVFCQWLEQRYDRAEATQIWEKTKRQYEQYLTETPLYGGIASESPLAVSTCLLVFALTASAPERLRAEDVQPLTEKIMMGGFVRLGKIFDLNRPQDMRLIHLAFKLVGKKRQKAFESDPTGFCCNLEPFDKIHQATRYDFTQCPHAEFAKRHDLLYILPAMCNCDFFGIEQIHGKLIRRGTCGNGDRCDYCVVGSQNPLAQKFETVRDEDGFLVSVEV